MANRESGYPRLDSGEQGEKLSPFLDELTRIETGLINTPSDENLQARRRALWSGATDQDLRAWTSVLPRLTQDPTSQITAEFGEILKEAEQLRAQAREDELKGEAGFTRAEKEEWDELKGARGDKKFFRWARDMEKHFGQNKRE